MFDFTPFFQRLGKRVVEELKLRMISQKGVDNNSYAQLRPKTIEQKKSQGFGTTASQRMIRTKDFINRAFDFVSGKSEVVIYIKRVRHGRNILQARKKTTRKKLAESAPLMTEIAEWQNKPERGLFFPQNQQEIGNLNSVKTAGTELNQEILRQMREKGMWGIKRTLKIG